MLSEGFNVVEVILASFLLESLEGKVVLLDSVDSGVSVVGGFFNFVLEVSNVGGDVVDVFGSGGKGSVGDFDGIEAPFAVCFIADVGGVLFVVNTGLEVIQGSFNFSKSVLSGDVI